MMKINKFILAVSASLVWCVSYGQQEEPARQHEPIKIDGVAAVVGKEIVLESDIEGALMQYQLQGISIGENEKCRDRWTVWKYPKAKYPTPSTRGYRCSYRT